MNFAHALLNVFLRLDVTKGWHWSVFVLSNLRHLLNLVLVHFKKDIKDEVSAHGCVNALF